MLVFPIHAATTTFKHQRVVEGLWSVLTWWTHSMLVFNFSLWNPVWNSTWMIYDLTCGVSIACRVVMKQTLFSLHKISNLPEIYVYFIFCYCEIQNFPQAMNDCMLIVPYCHCMRIHAGFRGNVQPPAPSRQLNKWQHAIIKSGSCCGQCCQGKLTWVIFHFQLENLDLKR